MKKLLFTAVLLSAAVVANAQFRFGVKAGVNFATGGSEDKTRTSLNAGVLAQYKFEGSGFAIQPEILYSGQGAKGTIDGVDATFALDYINVPVMLQYYVAPGFNLEFGPQVGFLVSAKLKASDSGNSASVDIKDAYNSVDFGIGLGAAYELPKLPLGFFARYNLGMSELYKDKDLQGENGAKHRVIQVGAFYKF